MSRRNMKAFNIANTYLIGMLFCACSIFTSTLDNEGPGIANTGQNGRLSDTTDRDVNGEITTTFITHPGRTLDETEGPFQTEQTTVKLDTLSETHSLKSTVQTATNQKSTGVLLDDGLFKAATNVMLTTTNTEYEFPESLAVVSFNILPELKLISERMLQLYAENETMGLIALAVSAICPEWIPCFDTEMIHSIVQTDNSCCLSCQCDDLCVSMWNCCPGYESSYAQVQQDQDRLSPICFNTAMFTRQTKVIQHAPYYYMVASCPDHTPQDLKNKCSAVLQNAEMNQEFIHAFSDIVPVTDDVTVTNFLNVHCATCNGITHEKLIFWKAEFTCNDGAINTADRNLFERSIQEREQCHLLLLPPNYLIGNATRCYNNVESRCNITGLWRDYDREVEGFCSTINWMYDTVVTETRYRNIFCAICNGEPNITSDTTCPFESPFILFKVFTGILNFNHNTGTRVSATSDSCQAGQLFDPLKDACQNVVCSIPHVLNYITKECDNLFDYISYGLIELPFEFIPREPFYLVDIGYYEHVFSQIIRSITGVFDCSKHAIFYKLGTPFSTLADKTQIRYDKIISVIIIVITDIRFPDVRNPSEIIGLFLNESKWAHGTSITFRYGRSDLFYLSPFDVDMKNETDESVKYMYIEDIFLSGTNLENRQYAMYEDPYDGAAVLYRDRDASKDDYCNTPYLFDRYHFDCPSFVYDIDHAGMVRVRNGILLIDHNITLTFGEFKSMNATHIAVCIESLRRKVLASQSSCNGLLSVFVFLNQLLVTLLVIFFVK